MATTSDLATKASLRRSRSAVDRRCEHGPEGLARPDPDIMRAAYGDATARIFMISAIVALVALIAVIFIKEVPLRKTVDASPEKELLANASGEAGMTLDTSALPVVDVV